VAQSGEQNQEFGIYKNGCCGAEIVISGRATFPNCPNHLMHSTTWSLLDERNYRSGEKKDSKSDSAA
jgi:hypothetical protein